MKLKMKMPPKKVWLQFLPLIAGGLGMISFSTLLITVHKTHNTTSFPFTWLLINITATVLATAYGFLTYAPGIYAPNILFLCGLFYMLAIKVLSDETKVKPDKDALQKQQQQQATTQQQAKQPTKFDSSSLPPPQPTNYSDLQSQPPWSTNSN
jgi:hypothetical protein